MSVEILLKFGRTYCQIVTKTCISKEVKKTSRAATIEIDRKSLFCARKVGESQVLSQFWGYLTPQETIVEF